MRKEYIAVRRRLHAIEQQWVVQQGAAGLRDTAARCIQTMWRSYRNRRIYMYYRDLIQFRERGDPKELLRVINPREAQLADAAAGVHVRFRLGGATFPPLVFYKIFTHRTVVDICAFGPRNYAGEVRMPAAEVHNRPAAAGVPSAASAAAASTTAPASPAGGGGKRRHEYRDKEEFELEEQLREYLKPDGTLGWRSTSGWYERHDNNGWRPVAERVLLEEDPVTTMTRLKRQPMFHHNHAQRREDRARRAKQRKREWLKKIYTDAAGGGGAPPAGALGLSADGLPLGQLDLEGLDDGALDGDRVEELLTWSQHLDFGSYVNDWTSMACSLGSEAYVPEDEAPYLAPLPPSTRDVHKAMAAAGVPLVPFKGGASAACAATGRMALSGA